MLDGWQSASSIGTGFPSYAVKGGVVYLSGSVRQVSGNDVEFTVLPKGARPAHLIVLPIYTEGDTTGWLELYTSLASISFPLGS